MKKILVTGASGFIGSALCSELVKSDFIVCGIGRNLDNSLNNCGYEYVSIGDINSQTNWKNILEKVDCIIHCAGRAHKMSENKELDLYHLVNTKGTIRLAEEAVKAGVKRLIFLSSAKVNGESTGKINNKEIFTNKDKPEPQDSYSISKLRAEEALWEISAKKGLEVTVVRLTLVYGKEVKGNLKNLIKLVKLGIPLPLSMVKNKRSMIGIDNLINLLIRCIDHPQACGKTFLVSDGEDLSTQKLINYIAKSMGLKARLFPVPLTILKFLGFIFGKQKEVNRLTGSLRVDNNHTQKVLNWKPPLSVEEGIRRMVQGK